MSEENQTIFDRFRSFLQFEQNRSPHTVREYLADVEHFADFITGGKTEDFRPESVTTSDIRLWLATEAKHIGPRSARRKLQSLRALFRYMMKREGLPANPASDITPAKLPKKLPRFVRAEELEEIIDSDRPDMKPWREERNKLIIDLLYSCGLRCAELRALNDSNIRRDTGEMKVLGKGNKTRIIPIPEPLMQKIEHWQHTRNSLWDSDDTDRPLIAGARGRLSAAAISKITGNMLATAKGGARNPHSLRHSFATAMLDGGADINSVKEFLGHVSLETTQIYTHVSIDQIRKAYKTAHPRGNKTEKTTD